MSRPCLFCQASLATEKPNQNKHTHTHPLASTSLTQSSVSPIILILLIIIIMKIVGIALVRTGPDLNEPIPLTVANDLSSFGFFQRQVRFSMICVRACVPQSINQSSKQSNSAVHNNRGISSVAWLSVQCPPLSSFLDCALTPFMLSRRFLPSILPSFPHSRSKKCCCF